MRIRHPWKIISAGLALGLGLVVAPGTASASPAQSAVSVPSVDTLPESYAEWNVDLRSVADDPRILHLTFDSPLLQHRVTNTVYLPSGYRPDGEAFPVMYALHGTVFPPLDNCALRPATDQEAFVQMISCGGGGLQDQLYDIPAQLDRMEFLVVSPDTNPADSVCETCAWIDGRDDLLPNAPPATAETLPADSFLHEELYPLVETLFDTRTDRAGRGVMGFSMGAWAAALQGMLHPDRYAYIGWNSGGYQLFEPQLQAVLNGLGYLRDQGYGTSVAHEIWWRQHNPADIATNIVGIDMHFLLSTGDGCLSPTSLSAPDCQGRYAPTATPSGAAVEQMLHRNWVIATNDLKNKGIPFEPVEMPGVHGSNNHRVFAEHIVPGANEIFAREVESPEEFSYRSVAPQFSAWGYKVKVDRANDEFLALSSARTDGRAMTLTGSGVVTLLTPAAFVPGQAYTVTASGEGSQSSEELIADESGRLKLRVDLGNSRLLNENTVVDGLGLTPAHSLQIRIDG